MNFIERTSAILGISPQKTTELFSIQHKSSLRFNTLKPLETAQNIITENPKDFTKINWCENAYIIEGNKSNYTGSEFFKNGNFYIQNASSYLPVIILDAKPQDVILDMCAAPGGKTIHIADMAENKSFIYVNDENKQRLNTLKKLTQIYGAEILYFFNMPAQFINKHTEQKFDKILLDAPCSGEGMINLQDSEPLKYWSENKIKRLSKLQKQLIDTAYKLLTKNGVLVYSTCTLAPEENEEIISDVLQKYDDLKVEDISNAFKLDNLRAGLASFNGKRYDSQLEKAIRVVPNSYMEAFFVCKLIKS